MGVRASFTMRLKPNTLLAQCSLKWGRISAATAFSQLGQGRGDWRSNAGGGGAPSTGRSGANPGELGYKGVGAVNSAQSSSAGQSRGLSQAPMTSLNNPTTNANYDNASYAMLQGLCGAVSTENSSADMNLNNPSTPPASSPNTSPSTRDRGET